MKFSKDLLIESNLNLFFRDSGLYLYSSADGTLDLSADSSIKLKNGSNVIVTIDSDSMDLSVNASLGSVADKVQLGGKDIAAGRRTFAIATEEPVNADVGLASTHSIIWEIDGSYYKIPLVSYTPP